jgi:hypothetical protein
MRRVDSRRDGGRRLRPGEPEYSLRGQRWSTAKWSGVGLSRPGRRGEVTVESNAPSTAPVRCHVVRTQLPPSALLHRTLRAQSDQVPTHSGERRAGLREDAVHAGTRQGVSSPTAARSRPRLERWGTPLGRPPCLEGALGSRSAKDDRSWVVVLRYRCECAAAMSCLTQAGGGHRFSLRRGPEEPDGRPRDRCRRSGTRLCDVEQGDRRHQMSSLAGTWAGRLCAAGQRPVWRSRCSG